MSGKGREARFVSKLNVTGLKDVGLIAFYQPVFCLENGERVSIKDSLHLGSVDGDCQQDTEVDFAFLPWIV